MLHRGLEEVGAHRLRHDGPLPAALRHTSCAVLPDAILLVRRDASALCGPAARGTRRLHEAVVRVAGRGAVGDEAVAVRERMGAALGPCEVRHGIDLSRCRMKLEAIELRCCHM